MNLERKVLNLSKALAALMAIVFVVFVIMDGGKGFLKTPPTYVPQTFSEFEDLRRRQHGTNYITTGGELQEIVFRPPVETMEEFFNRLDANNRKLLILYLQGNRDPKVKEAFDEICTLWFGTFGQQGFVKFWDADDASEEEDSE